jgi:glutamate decarboxylase
VSEADDQTKEKQVPLHDKDSIRQQIDDEIYASADLSISMPKYRFPAREHDPRHAYSVVHDELMLDGNSRQNLATFCQTWAEPEVHRLMDECIDQNMADKDEYPQTAEITARCVHMLGDMKRAIEYFDKHPVQAHLTRAEASGFHH